MYLRELTGHDAGIIVFDDNSVIVANWESANAEKDDAMPAVFSGALIWMKRDGIFENAEHKRFEDIREELPEEIDVLYDYNDDMTQIFSQDEKESGDVYTLKDGTRIFAIDSWC